MTDLLILLTIVVAYALLTALADKRQIVRCDSLLAGMFPMLNFAFQPAVTPPHGCVPDAAPALCPCCQDCSAAVAAIPVTDDDTDDEHPVHYGPCPIDAICLKSADL